MRTPSPEAPSESRIRSAARSFYENIRALQGGSVAAEDARAENRRIRADLSEDEWTQAKARALSQL